MACVRVIFLLQLKLTRRKFAKLLKDPASMALMFVPRITNWVMFESLIAENISPVTLLISPLLTSRVVSCGSLP